MKRRAGAREVARTVLVVGEGDAEVLFLRHLKSLYVRRGSGVVVTIKNARGKGAAHVVDFTHRQARNAAYDVRAAMLDTDTDWNDATRNLARKAGVQVLACEPCLEAALLSVHHVSVHALDSVRLKREFANRFGAPASDSSVLRHFDLGVLEAARARVGVLAALLGLMEDGVASVD